MEETKVERKSSLRKRHPVVFWGCVSIEGIVILFSVFSAITGQADFLGISIFLNLLAIPAILTFINISLIYIKPKLEREWRLKIRGFEILSVLIGYIFSSFFIQLDTRYVDWYTQIARSENHSPIWTESMPTFIILCLVAIAGYLILSFIPTKKTPPLITVLAISALYIGIFECIMWSIQVYENELLLVVFPINCIIIAARLIREKAFELKKERENSPNNKNGFINKINNELMSSRFPIWALILIFPLLGIIFVILVLFGQHPENIIKGYTETADWMLSQKIAPPGYDDHYLCTVAAQGHKHLVKPQRIGVRHGRKTIVNRQLCIANAFEQILEERTPKIHKAVRNFYDTHGFPLSKLIKTRSMADFVYIIMKPLEWLFLIILYLFTTNPEERISKQYTK